MSGEQPQEVKIAAPEYAARKFGNPEDAAEFVRCLHLIAGRDASALYLQQLASHYYAEAKRRPTSDVLKEMGLLALEMAAVTVMNEQLEFGGDEAEGDTSTVAGWNDLSFLDEEDARLSISERRTRWMERAARVLGEDEAVGRGSIFSSEIQTQTQLIYRKTAGVFDHDEYSEHLRCVSAATEDDEAFGAYLDSFERILEQYDEGFAVSLHMTDGERKIACGELEDDVDEESLPECARHLGDELRRLYTGGFPLHDRGEVSGVEGVTLTAFVRDPITRERVSVPVTVYGIDTWLDAAVDEAFGGRVARTLRRYVWLPDTKRQPRQVARETVVPRIVETEVTKRGKTIRRKEVRHYIERSVALVPCSRLHEQTETVDVCPNPNEQLEALARSARQERVVERKEAFDRMRDEIETKVVAYLTDVVRTREAASLEREAAHHTHSVTRVIKETLREHGYDLAAFNLDDARVNQVTGRLIDELPGAIRAVVHEREQTRAHEHQLGDIERRDALLPDRAAERAAELYIRAPNDYANLASRRHATPAHPQHPDDEIVEQKISQTIGQTLEQIVLRAHANIDYEHHLVEPAPSAREPNAPSRDGPARSFTLMR